MFYEEYNQPFYLPSMTPYYPLAMYGDYTTMFLQACYRINHTKFVSRTQNGTVFPPLKNIFDYRGKSIIPEGIDISQYRLLSEIRNDTCPFFSEVTEIYGFTPSKRFNKVVTVSWTRPALKVYENTKNDFEIGKNQCTTDSDGNITIINNFIFTLEVGSVIELSGEGYLEDDENNNSNVYFTASATVKSITSSTITLNPFDWTIIPTDSSSDSEADSSSGSESRNYTVHSSADNAPQKVFDSFLFSAPTSFSKTTSIDYVKYEKQEEKITVYLDNTKTNFIAGDIVYFYANPVRYDGLAEWASWRAQYAYVRVLTSTPTYIVVPYFEATVHGANTSYPSDSQDTGFIFDYPYLHTPIGGGGALGAHWYGGGVTATFAGNIRAEYSGDLSGLQQTDFVTVNGDSFNISQPFVPREGGNLTTQINSTSEPTSEQYQSMIANKTRLLVAPESYAQLMGDVYIRTRITVEAQ